MLALRREQHDGSPRYDVFSSSTARISATSWAARRVPALQREQFELDAYQRYDDDD